jgi:uncharacterized iron-regulated membrane protein
MKKFKKITGWLHLWLGLAVGLVLIIVALTGSLLAFEQELEPILFKTREVVIPTGQRLQADSLINIANAAFANSKVSRLIIPQDPTRSVEARIGAKGEKELKVAFINPYNGQILYKGIYTRLFYQQVRSLHRYLFLGATGKIITGISCSITLFMVISGLVIWWPASKSAIKQRFKIKWDASGKRLTWDLHAVTGFYLSIILLCITLTGFVWSYDWADHLIYQLADGKKTEKTDKIKNIAKGKKIKPGIYQVMMVQTDSIYHYPGSVAFNIPAKGALAVTVQKEPEASRARQIDAAYFDSHTGKLLSTLPYSKLTTGDKVRRMILTIHTGSLLGWPTKLLYLLTALFTASLPVTGFLMWLGKQKKSKKKTSRPIARVKIA